MLKPQDLIRMAVEGEIRKGDRFRIFTEGELDPIKILEYDIDREGNAAFFCVEESKDVADSSIILCNEFERM